MKHLECDACPTVRTIAADNPTCEVQLIKFGFQTASSVDAIITKHLCSACRLRYIAAIKQLNETFFKSEGEQNHGTME